MYQMRFIDGTPVPKDYSDSVSNLVSGACKALDLHTEDELEAYAEVLKLQGALEEAKTELEDINECNDLEDRLEISLRIAKLEKQLAYAQSKI
jgi:predicted Zn-dependent protease